MEIFQKLSQEIAYLKLTLGVKEFDSFIEKKKKNYVKLLKKTCRTRWLSLHAGVDADFGEYKDLIYTLKDMQNDKVSGPTASGMLKKMKSHYEFLGTFYLLKNILPNLAGLSKTFKQETSTLRISPAINRCKSKILEIAKGDRVIQQLKEDLNARLKAPNIISRES